MAAALELKVENKEDEKVTELVNSEKKITEEKIEIEISDTGEGIENIEEAKEPLFTSKCNLERSGMGFTIMESFMDNLKVESIVGLGTKITMKKKIRNDEKVLQASTYEIK